MKIEGLDYSRDHNENYYGKPQLLISDKREITEINDLIMSGQDVAVVSYSVLSFLKDHKHEIVNMLHTKYPEEVLKESYKDLIDYLEILDD